MKEIIEHRFPLPAIMKATIIMFFWVLLYVILDRFRNILYPPILGILFALLLRPIKNFLENKKFPKILAVLISLFLGIGVIYGTLFTVSSQVSQVLRDSNELEVQAHANMNSALQFVEDNFSVSVHEQKEWLRHNIKGITSGSTASVNKAIGATTQTLFTVGILPVYVFFILFYSHRFKTFFLLITNAKKNIKAPRILSEIAHVTQKYMSGMFLVVFILFIINSTGFYLIGLKHPVLFGAIAAIMNFIPYFGTIFGFSVPFGVSLIIMDSPSYALKILIMFFIVQFTENNLLTPNIVGNQLKINPLVIIFSVLFGGAVWGLPGMFVIVPIVGMLKIICMAVPKLQAWGYLLGTDEDVK